MKHPTAIERFRLDVVYFIVCVLCLWVALWLDVNRCANEWNRVARLERDSVASFRLAHEAALPRIPRP